MKINETLKEELELILITMMEYIEDNPGLLGRNTAKPLSSDDFLIKIKLALNQLEGL
jgi:hypothetical protein